MCDNLLVHRGQNWLPRATLAKICQNGFFCVVRCSRDVPRLVGVRVYRLPEERSMINSRHPVLEIVRISLISVLERRISLVFGN